MKVRRLDDDGDMVLGHGAYDYHDGTAEGVAQCVMTRLALWKGAWFIDTDEGTPWIQEILGKHEAVEAVLRSRILETPGVQELDSFEVVFDPDTRKIQITAEIETIYGDATVGATL